MTDTSKETVERLLDAVHESKAGRQIRHDVIAMFRALLAEREALTAEVARLTAALADHNDLLRSSLQIAKREGVNGEIATTNWDAFYNRVAVVLRRYQDIVISAHAVRLEGGVE